MTPTDEALVTRGEMAALALAATITIALTTVLAGGAVSGLVFGRGWAWPRAAQLPSTLGDLVTHPGQPSGAYGPTLGRLLPSPALFWGTVATLLSLAVIGAGFLAAGAAQRRHQPGMATRRQIRKVARESDAGCAFGTYLGVPVRARGEDSALTIAPARAGKTTRLAVGRVIDAPGAVVATSTKADLVQLTAFARAATGKAHVFDPDAMLAWQTPCRWDIVAGCEDVREAMTRARAMVAARPLNSDRNSSFFEGASETVLRCLLHAAAIDGASMREVLAWARDFTDDAPYEILRSHPGAAVGWLQDLRKFCRAGAPETVSSTAMSLGLILKAMADDRVVDLVCPAAGEGLDVESFVRGGTDTLYLVSEGGEGISTAPLVTAFASAVVSCARRLSQTRPGGRLDPPLTFVLDEAANVAPLPDLPMMMADGGGRGMSTWAFVQSFAQLRARWGRDGADSIWGASSIKLLLGGCTEADDLEKISRVVGDRRVRRQSHSSPGGLVSRAQVSTSTSMERERILPVEALARIPVGQALLLYRAVPAALVQLPAWWERKDARVFKSSQAQALRATGRTA
jgi:type IV secretion system protein VirD4